MSGSPIAVLLAGGQGQRFWPRSRAAFPKQFLSLVGGRSLLQEAFRRAALAVGQDRVVVIAGRRHAGLVHAQLPDLAKERLLLEPEGRDTAAALAFAAQWAANYDPGAPLLVLPSDHHVEGDEAFREAALQALHYAASSGDLVTIGLQPTRPETGYGYLILHTQVLDPGPPPVRRVIRFQEKPSIDDAVRLVSQTGVLWNAGMFAFMPERFLAELARQLPDHALAVRALIEADTPETKQAAEALYVRLPKLSVDKGVMENAPRVATVVGAFAWDDVGTWAALARLCPPDEGGNVLLGPTVAIDSQDLLVDARSQGRLVVTFGVRDLVVADTRDAVLVAHRERAADLKEVAESLGALGLHGYVDRVGGPLAVPGDAVVVDKPWGREVWWAHTPAYAGKILEIRAGEALSLQYHRLKRESMWIVSGQGTLTLGHRQIAVEPGSAYDIPPMTIHRLEAETDLTVVEVSSGELEDVVRLEDRYGRAAVTAQASG